MSRGMAIVKLYGALLSSSDRPIGSVPIIITPFGASPTAITSTLTFSPGWTTVPSAGAVILSAEAAVIALAIAHPIPLHNATLCNVARRAMVRMLFLREQNEGRLSCRLIQHLNNRCLNGVDTPQRVDLAGPQKTQAEASDYVGRMNKSAYSTRGSAVVSLAGKGHDCIAVLAENGRPASHR